MWSFVHRHAGLDRNSSYAYLLFAHEFGDTCAVVDDASGDLAGFVLGFRPPARPDSLFVWQVAVSPEHRGRRLADDMIAGIVARPGLDLKFVEATVTPDNEPSRRMFQRFAESRGVPCRVTPYLGVDDFPADDASHESEDRFRIGPLDVGARGDGP
jgi:L-2,4-diaminobutyric acid acetyltransferase